jgi:protein ImuB
VEAATDEPGVFWLSGTGMGRLFRSVNAWARGIHAALAERNRLATVAVGFRRFAVYALARAGDGVRVFAAPKDEDAALARVPLAVLGIDPDLRDTLAKLAVRTVGDFLKLPPQGIKRRFGAEAARLHDLAAGTRAEPIVPTPPVEPVADAVLLEEPEGNATALVFLIRRSLHPLLTRLARRSEALRELKLRFVLERADPRTDAIRPAEPTLDLALIVDLVRLRLEAAPLPAPASEIHLTAHGAPADRRQLQLFFETPKRDLAAGDRALARVRAELGDQAVVRARLAEGHLPEARFVWEALARLTFPKPNADATPVLVRRVYDRPIPLAPRPRHEPDGWIIRDLRCGPVLRMWGPHVVSGGWWRGGVERRYYYLETQRGDLLWVYYDGPRRRWFLHGQVE